MSTPRPALGADRLVYFSDAVVAIAITLLVLPLVDVVPEGLGRNEGTGEILAGHWGQILAFLIGFTVIARLWVTHHRLFDGVQRVASPVVVADLFWLLTIVVLPFPTALLGGAADDPGTTRLYVGVLAISTVTLTLLTVLARSSFVTASDPPDERFLRGVTISSGLIVVAFVVSLILARPTTAVLLVLFVDPVVEGLWNRFRRPRAAGPG